MDGFCHWFPNPSRIEVSFDEWAESIIPLSWWRSDEEVLQILKHASASISNLAMNILPFENVQIPPMEKIFTPENIKKAENEKYGRPKKLH